MNHSTRFFLISLIIGLVAAGTAYAQTPARKLFGTKQLPAAMDAEVQGFYSKGCVAGAVAIPVDGPNWQAMRLSRNRRWGHPTLVGIIEELSYKAKADGWNGLMVGDMSQPRGGPMLTGHRSHQSGLDADIWFTPMPDKRLTYKEREDTSAVLVLEKNSFYVNEKRWTRAYERLLFHAASFPEVERILVHPGVKKKLCDTVKGERAWLKKIRPFWSHNYHFHLRIGCPAGSPGCKSQAPTGSDIGCGSSLKWWFDVGLKPPKTPASVPTPAPPPKKRRELVVADLPNACSAVLKAQDQNLAAATYKVRDTAFVAPEIKLPQSSAAKILNSKPIEASAGTVSFETKIAVPTPRPGD